MKETLCRKRQGSNTLWLLRLASVMSLTLSAAAQQPVLSYTVAVDDQDTSAVQFTLRARNLPATCHLAMVNHFLVDDGYWRYVEDLRISSGRITRQESGLWRVTGAGADATVRYRIRLGEKDAQRVVRKPFLTSSGGLIGGVHMFLYLVEAPQTPMHVTLHIPADWQVATTLTPTSAGRTFHARDARDLSDSPLLIGKLRESRFELDQVPFRVAYWPLPKAKPFEEKGLVDGLRRIAERAGELFGGFPWREYLFQVRDGTIVDGFEHTDGVTIGVPSADLADGKNPDYVMIAHEFFHAWNIMRIQPAEYQGVSYRPVELSGLWVSEGFTVFFADLLVRRAGLPAPMPTRLAYLEGLLEYYLANPEHERFSAEESSRGAFRPPAGDRYPDRYMLWIQSELLAAMLDLTIRDATNGQRSLDDLMRALYAAFPGPPGFTTNDIERLAEKVSGRNLKTFFDRYVRRAGRIDAERYLALAGLGMTKTQVKATTPDGALKPDTRIYAMPATDDGNLRLYVAHPHSVWLRAGLRNGDQLRSMNGSPVESEVEFDDRLNALQVGDRVRVEVLRSGRVLPFTVPIESYDWPKVKLSEIATASDRQKAILAAWQAGR